MSNEDVKPEIEKAYNDITGEDELIRYEWKQVPVKVSKEEEEKLWEEFTSLVDRRNELQDEFNDVTESLKKFEGIFDEEEIEYDEEDSDEE